jgi:biopolymer transport protein ExbB
MQRHSARRLAGLIGLMLGLLLAGTVPAQAWWNADWSYRMRIVVGAGGEEGGQPVPLGRTTILVRLHQGVFNFNNAREDGADIRFVSGDDRTALRFSIERYDSLVDQVGLLWVTIPDLTLRGEGTPIYMYWGNKNAPPAGSARDTFDTETVLALNFADDAGAPRDATGYGNNATAGARRDDGLIGFGHRFDGTATVRLPDTATLGWGAGGPVTWSFWLRPDASGSSGVLYQARGPAGGVTIGLEGGVPYAEIDNAGTITRIFGTTAIEGESWRHLGLVAAGGRALLYLDARLQGEVAANLPALGGAAAIGGAMPLAPIVPAAAPAPAPAAVVPPGTAPATTTAPAAPADPAAAPVPAAAPPTPGFVGVIDVFRIAKAERSPAFLEVAVRGEGPRSDLLRFDVPEEGSIFGSGHFGIIARNLTHDAWAVIAICGLMMPVTWFIFARKSFYLSGSVKANRIFRRAFRDALISAGTRGIAGVEGLSDAAAHRRHRRSPLYRFWRTTLEEMDIRGGIHRAGKLSANSLAAIRAAIDREITQEGQRLNSGIVMLTIAISGGPFIGLLGTVMGVMITFAAVAAAGDVNVNAIAPGVAAALAATVAGLAVAIPALFGYNYLLTRIRDVNADMRVFADELVTLVGEGGIEAPPIGAPTMLKAAE